MIDIDQLQKELAEIEQELTMLDDDSRAYRNLSAEKAAIEAQLIGAGAIAQGSGAFAVGSLAIGVTGEVGGDVLGPGAVKQEYHYHNDSTQNKKLLSTGNALQHYLNNVIAEYQLLRLQGIRAGSQPLSVALEKVYVSLTTIDKQTEEKSDFHTDSGALSIADALQRYRRLVIIGDPGCGKTTLLSYIALTYARTYKRMMPVTTDIAKQDAIIAKNEAEQEAIITKNETEQKALIQKNEDDEYALIEKNDIEQRKLAKTKYAQDELTKEIEIAKKKLKNKTEDAQKKLHQETNADKRQLFAKTNATRQEIFAKINPAMQEAVAVMQQRLQLNEVDYLPILMPLRTLARDIKVKHPDSGKDGPKLLLDYLHEYYLGQNISLPEDFFAAPLESGKAVLLLDGMDEVAENTLRQRMARLIEKFTERYPKCRFVVTSREVGYEGAARVGAKFGLAKVRDFSPAEVRQFVRDWTRIVETTLVGSEAPETLRMADGQAQQLIQAIDSTPRVAELAVNPLLLTVIALVHRYRARLPERRSELYEEAVEVLLGHWDGAKPDMDIAMDTGDWRSLLEPVAFWMHERKKREIELDELRTLLEPTFMNSVGQPQKAAKATTDFLKKINERSGLLIERGVGIYGFAHLTFQEYLAGRALADRQDAIAYTLRCLPDGWWREVILLQAGYLSTQGKNRVSDLIAAILDADPKTEPEPHHHLLLAAECLFDVGNARVKGDLLGEARRRLQVQADAPLKKGDKPALLGKLAAMNALARLDSGQIVSQFWKMPWGEPEWVVIPAGEFWMGDDKGNESEKPMHKLFLPEYRIARASVTNVQYAIYVKDSGTQPPKHWRGGQVPPGLENHPVVNVTWRNALAYCRWLGEKINQQVTLPSEAEWEKSARGNLGKRTYPWGETWKELHCNSAELGLNDTTPVGLFLNGVSPYGLLDMSSNVWEWTRTIWDDKFGYPYKDNDGRENLETNSWRVLRGGSFGNVSSRAYCSYRHRYHLPDSDRNLGFRVAIVVS